VSDLIAGIYRLMMSSYALPVNIGNPTEMTVLEFAREISVLPARAAKSFFKPLPQDDPKQRRPDITRARQHLDWEPKVSLAGGWRKRLSSFAGRCE